MMKFLQDNAEWMCAIAIVIFTAVQIILYIIQLKRDLRFKRLDLAQKVDDICKDLPADKTEARKIIAFMNANRSLFITLLNKKDIKNYTNLYRLLAVLATDKKYPASEIPSHVKLFMEHVDALSSALCNANYGLNRYKLDDPFGDEKNGKVGKS